MMKSQCSPPTAANLCAASLFLSFQEIESVHRARGKKRHTTKRNTAITRRNQTHLARECAPSTKVNGSRCSCD